MFSYYFNYLLIHLLIYVNIAQFSVADENEVIDHHRVDREAFLGPDDAKQFENLSIDESKKKLAQIVDKIDKDKDGFVTLKELEVWIKTVQKNFIERDVEKNWKIHNPQNLDKLSWQEYRAGNLVFN